MPPILQKINNGGVSAAGIIFDYSPHYIDHLAPLCSLLNIPLIVYDAASASLINHYYPPQELIISQDSFDHVKRFDIFFCCSPKPLFDQFFFLPLLKKQVKTIWCPHGNSDKGHKVPLMEGLKHEEYAVLYGDKIIDFMKEKGSFDQLKSYARVGNYRYEFYQKHKKFYQRLRKKEIIPLIDKQKKTILYAPTWDDAEKSSSFFDAAPHLEKLKSKYNLLIKPHPNLPKSALSDFLPIYPLLDQVDLYLGDMSSIGYDFLKFDKPMFFLTENRTDLQRCGVSIPKSDYHQIDKIIDEQFHLNFSKERKELYRYTFTI